MVSLIATSVRGSGSQQRNAVVNFGVSPNIMHLAKFNYHLSKSPSKSNAHVIFKGITTLFSNIGFSIVTELFECLLTFTCKMSLQGFEFVRHLSFTILIISPQRDIVFQIQSDQFLNSMLKVSAVIPKRIAHHLKNAITSVWCSYCGTLPMNIHHGSSHPQNQTITKEGWNKMYVKLFDLCPVLVKAAPQGVFLWENEGKEEQAIGSW